MAVPQGILGALQNSPFANSIRKVAQPIDNGYRGPTQMGPQAALDGTGAVFGNMFSPMTVDNNYSQMPDFFALQNQGPMPRGGYESITENKPAIDLTSLLSGLGGLIPENRLSEVVSAPTRSRLRYDPNTITTDRFGRRVASAVSADGTIDPSNSIYVDSEDKRVQNDFDMKMAEFNKQQEALGEGFTRGQLRDYNAQNRLQGMKDKFTNIEQGFFDSPEFAEYLQAGKGVGTADVRFSPYFGRQSSGSVGGAQDTAYEKYLNRAGLTDYLQGGQNFKQAEGYVQPSIGILKEATGMPDTRGPNVPGNRPPNPNNSLIDPGFSPQPGMFRPTEINPNFRPGYRPGGMNPIDIYARPQPGMFPQPVETNPNYGPNLPYRPNPNMYQRPMRRPFGFGGRRPMNPFMGMGLGMMNPMGMGMFGGFSMRPPMFGGYGGGYGGRPMMGYGLGAANPYGMSPYSNFGRPTPYSQPSYSRPNPYQQPSYNRPNPYSSGMNIRPPSFGGGQPQPSYMPVMQQQPQQQQPQYNNMYQQPQQGYGGYQQPSGYGNYGGMQNPYQPQQMGNANNFAGYGQQQPAGMF